MSAGHLVKRLIVGTRFDPLARKLQRTMREVRGTSHIEQMSRRYDRLTFQIMDRVLRRDSNCIDVGCLVGDILWEMYVRAPLGRHPQRCAWREIPFC